MANTLWLDAVLSTKSETWEGVEPSRCYIAIPEALFLVVVYVEIPRVVGISRKSMQTWDLSSVVHVEVF